MIWMLLFLLVLAVLVYFRFGLKPSFGLKLIPKKMNFFLGFLGSVAIAIAGGSFASAQLANPSPLNAITSLPAPTAGDPTPASPPLIAQVPVPSPSSLATFVSDETALLKLGKSLFWDMQLGSDGIQSCASCHFHAGADNRSKNQVNPGFLQLPTKDPTFQVGGGPNYQLTMADFPFHKLNDPNNRTSGVVRTSNDVVSSQGAFHAQLVKTEMGQTADTVLSTPDPDGFTINGTNVRRVEPRNAPTVIDTIYNKLQFWDGRAKETFNGVNIKGRTDPTAKVYRADSLTTLTAVNVALDNSSLASLVTGPPLSVFEMSAAGRESSDIGRKFLSLSGGRTLARSGKKLTTLRPLGQQIVHPQDSVLGADSRAPQPGLAIPSYDDLVKQAFKKEWWQSNKIIQLSADGSQTVLQQAGLARNLPANQFELRQWNFPLFAGLAMQKYMSTLVSTQTPFDKFQAGDTTALTEQEKNGLRLFVTSSNGTTTKAGTTGASCNTCHAIPEFTTASVRRTAGIQSTDAGNRLLTFANGFIRNYGVTPCAEDPGAGSCPNGSLFKVPTLRNIGLTAPYMHNGGMATLEQVVDFYNRGRGDDPGSTPAALLGLDAQKKADLVAFLRNGLTDSRVLYEQAPFDHPQLFIPNGHPGNQVAVSPNFNRNGTPTATDALVEIPPVGRNGVTAPQPNFLGATLPISRAPVQPNSTRYNLNQPGNILPPGWGRGRVIQNGSVSEVRSNPVSTSRSKPGRRLKPESKSKPASKSKPLLR